MSNDEEAFLEEEHEAELAALNAEIDKQVLIFEERGAEYRELEEKVWEECEKVPGFYDVSVESSALKTAAKKAREAWNKTVGDVGDACGACLQPLPHFLLPTSLSSSP